MKQVEQGARIEKRSSIYRRLVGGALASVALLSLSKSAEQVAPTLPAETSIAAIGDSFTSGHANGDVDNRYDECFRHDISYANQIAKELGIENFTNVACSGATPDEIIDGKFGEPSQLDALDENTDFVLLTMGANAVNISGLLQKCLEYECDVQDPTFTLALKRVRSQEFTDELLAVYLAIADKAPNATTISVEYPSITGINSPSGVALTSLVTPLMKKLDINIDTLSSMQPYIANGMLEFVDGYVSEVNAANRRAIDQARGLGIRVITSPQTTSIAAIPNFGRTFHLDPNNYRALAHPNEVGHTGIKNDVMVTLAAAQYTIDSIDQLPAFASAGVEEE